MKIDGLGIADLPVMSSANQDDLLLIVQNNALKLQSYNNLTGTFSAISGSFKVDGIALPKVDASSVPPTDELVLIVENNGLAVKQVGIGAPSMPVGSFIDVDGVQIPSIRFSGNIDGDELCVAIRNNNTCLIPIPLSFSVGALPISGRLLFAPLKSSLVLSEGTGSPIFTRATKAWGFNELGYLTEIASGCAFFGGARLVRNTVSTKSEDVSNAAWVKVNSTITGTDTVVCANATSAQSLYTNNNYPAAPGSLVQAKARITYVDTAFVQFRSGGGLNGTAYVNFDLVSGSYSLNGTGAIAASMTAVSAGVYDCTFTYQITSAIADTALSISFINNMAATRAATFIGDGVKSFIVTRAQVCDVTNYDASYVPEYVSVGVEASPYFGAGIDGAKYFETDWQGAPIAAANLLGFRREAAATNNLLHCRDLTQSAWTQTGVSGSEIITNGAFDADTDWSKTAGWAIGSGQATCTANGSNQAISQASATAYVSGTKYVLSYTVVSNTLNAGTLRVGGYSGSSGFGISPTTLPSAVGAQSTALTASPTGTGVTLDLWVNGATTGALVIDNVSIKLAAVQPTKTATGLDGIANSATTLTATAADAVILQPITLASAARCASAYVKRRTGTGTISFTQDGTNWTDITAQINSSTWSRVQITSTLANPSTGFKISTSGDAIDVDVVQNEAGSVATSPIITTTATVTRNADSLTYQTASNWSDTAGTAFVEVAPLAYSGGAIGSATNGLLLSTSNSGATASDGTNSVNGPSGTPGSSEKLAFRWGSGAMTVSSGGVIGTPGIYDGSMDLTVIGIGSSAAGCFKNLAIYDAAMDDSTFAAVTA